MKPKLTAALQVLSLAALLASLLAACADKPRPRDVHRDSARLTDEPLDPTDLNGRLLHTVGLP